MEKVVEEDEKKSLVRNGGEGSSLMDSQKFGKISPYLSVLLSVERQRMLSGWDYCTTAYF